MIKSILTNKKILITAVSFSALLIIVKILESFFFHYRFSFETYAGIIAVIFLILGIYFGSKLGNKKSSIQDTPILNGGSHNSININNGIETDLSARELEVLLNITHGLSNQEIADKLFVSLNTIKTHTGNIYSKLGVKSRTQAVSKAKSLNLIH